MVRDLDLVRYLIRVWVYYRRMAWVIWVGERDSREMGEVHQSGENHN